MPSIYTVVQKERIFLKNNCNFFYFQYKKIMLTWKQPVINAVLITYIDYSITENYIRKMASFLPYTCPEPLHTFTNISCGTVAISSRMETQIVDYMVFELLIWGSPKERNSPDYYPFQKHAFFLHHPVFYLLVCMCHDCRSICRIIVEHGAVSCL